VPSYEDFAAKFEQTKGHAEELVAARADAVAKHEAAAAAVAAAEAADAAVVADVQTLEADKAELHALVDALFPSA
jgi:hypothetical protein